MEIEKKARARLSELPMTITAVSHMNDRRMNMATASARPDRKPNRLEKRVNQATEALSRIASNPALREVTKHDKNRDIKRKRDGRVVRRVTLYLPNNLVHDLKVVCAKADSDVSSFVAELVAKRLESESD